MDGGQVVALVAAIVSPVAALAGVWLTSNLARHQRQREQEDKARADALETLGHLAAILVDATPSLVYAGDLREFASRKDAVAGLYKRWVTAREPMMVLYVSHPSAEVRKLAFDVQAGLELVLRLIDDAIKSSGSLDDANRAHVECAKQTVRLGELLSPFGPRGRLED